MIIGIAGKARHGKDTVCSILEEMLGGKGKRIACADPLKDLVDEIFGFNLRHRDGDLKEVKDEYVLRLSGTSVCNLVQSEYGLDNKSTLSFLSAFVTALHSKGVSTSYEGDYGVAKNLSPRIAYQCWGRAGREISTDFWVDRLIDQHKKHGRPISIVPDIRFDDEASVCDLLIKVTAPNVNITIEDDVSEAGITVPVTEEFINYYDPGRSSTHHYNKRAMEDLKLKCGDFMYVHNLAGNPE